MIKELNFETWMENNDSFLQDYWDVYKYENLGDCFYYDDVDYFCECSYESMAYEIYEASWLGKYMVRYKQETLTESIESVVECFENLLDVNDYLKQNKVNEAVIELYKFID